MLRRRLRDGGWSLTAATSTSPAAYLGSLAVCHTEPAFMPYSGATPVPHASQLHGWLDDSLQRVRQAAPGAEYQTDIDPVMPASAGTFFSFHIAADPTVTAQLQRALNAKANKHCVTAAVERIKGLSKQGQKREWAHHPAITAKGAWGWKIVRPDGPHSRLSNVEYAIAARLDLDLQPFPPQTMATLPEHCPLCTHRVTGTAVSLLDDPWHSLSCPNLVPGELSRRHHAVVDAIARVAWQVGA